MLVLPNRRLMFAVDTTEVGAGSNPFDQLIPDGDDAGETSSEPTAAGAVDVDADSTDADETGDADPDGADELGDAGKQALARMKEKLKAERARRIAAEERANAASDDDEQARIAREIDQKATAKANARIVRAEVKAAAKGRLADPTDVFRYPEIVDLSAFEVDEDGEIDSDEVETAIADLLRLKPHLAAQGGSKTPKPDRSQGATGTGAATNAQRFAADLTRAGL